MEQEFSYYTMLDSVWSKNSVITPCWIVYGARIQLLHHVGYCMEQEFSYYTMLDTVWSKNLVITPCWIVYEARIQLLHDVG